VLQQNKSNDLGQVLLTESHLSSDLSIDIHTLPVGIYVMRLVGSNQKSESFKFVKI
jgi:hypothetical protein